MSLPTFIVQSTALGTLISHILIVLFVGGIILRLRIARKAAIFLGPYTPHIALVVALLGAIGSVLFSEVIGFEPCVLCWIARIFLYPQIIILFIAIIRKDKNIAPYILGLSIPGAIISLYQAYTQLGGHSITECTSVGGSCSKVYILEYGYITIPLMAFTAFLWTTVLMVIQKKYTLK